MPTDIDNQVQEVADPNVDKRPDFATSKESAVSPKTNTMDGNVESAYLSLLRIIEELKKRETPNDEMLERALSIKKHYDNSKDISEEQYAWIDMFINPPTPPLPGPEVMLPGEPSEPILEPEKDAERIKKRDAELIERIKSRDAEAPSNESSTVPVEEEQDIPDEVIEDIIEPDSSPSGEDQTDEKLV